MKLQMTFLFSALIVLFGCQTETNSIPSAPDSTPLLEEEFDMARHQKKYTQLKTYISQKKSMLSTSRMNQETKELQTQKFISTTLIDSIFPYWLGTKWDFNGITPEPKKGEIACGYFVSTTLRDVGIKLNRYKTAQKAASDIVKQLCEPSTIQTCGSYDQLIDYLSNVPNEDVLIVGLDFHVGFIFKRENTAYFAHSNYINREGVINERLDTSKAIKASEAYVIGSVTKNQELIKNWLN